MKKESALWHRVSDKEKQEIKKQAKKLMDDFARSLERLPKLKENPVERKAQTREEKEPAKPDPEFRKILFENAPEKKDDCIVAEKGGWEK